MIGLPTLPSFATEQREQQLSAEDLEAVPDVIHNVLNWLDRLAGALLRQHTTNKFPKTQRKRGVRHCASSLSATEQEARTATRKAKCDISKASLAVRAMAKSKKPSGKCTRKSKRDFGICAVADVHIFHRPCVDCSRITDKLCDECYAKYKDTCAR